MTTAPSCAGCRYFHPGLLPVWGECRRHPPVIFVDYASDGDLLTVWPRVDPDAWCGEFEPAKAHHRARLLDNPEEP